jgi:hypothetical protein
LGRHEWRNAVGQVNTSWVQTKLRSSNPPQNFGVPANDLIEPYHALAQLNNDFALGIDGLILKRGGAYVAFSVWETPRAGDIVPCIAALPCSHETGLSEYLYYCIARQLQRDGHDSMCIGGSETIGLDQFKQKLNPTGIHRLRTIKLSSWDQRIQLLSAIHDQSHVHATTKFSRAGRGVGGGNNKVLRTRTSRRALYSAS